MKVLLIAGHGDGDSGAVGFGYQEAELTREVVQLVKPELDKYADVTVADLGRDMFQYLKTHSYDFTPYQYVLEVHFNSGSSDLNGNGRTTGTEIYVPTSETGVGVEEAILRNMEKIGFRNRGVKRKNWSVISKIKAQGVSAALMEVAFIDDRDDIDLYLRKKYEIPTAIADGIAEGFGLKKEETDVTETQYEELKKRVDELERRVAKAENVMIYNYIDENMPEWARPTIQKLVDKGYLRGDAEGKLGLTDEMLRIFVVNDRAGDYGE